MIGGSTFPVLHRSGSYDVWRLGLVSRGSAGFPTLPIETGSNSDRETRLAPDFQGYWTGLS